MGELKPASELVGLASDVKAPAAGGVQAPAPVGGTSSNCGLEKSCLPDEFPVHVFSGKENVEGPRMCINGN